MKSSTRIGFCRACGFDVMAGHVACSACGSEAQPFIMAEHELKSGVLTLPFGLSASGLDTPEGRMLFLSEAGQAGLQNAYRVVLGELDTKGIQQ